MPLAVALGLVGPIAVCSQSLVFAACRVFFGVLALSRQKLGMAPVSTLTAAPGGDFRDPQFRRQMPAIEAKDPLNASGGNVTRAGKSEEAGQVLSSIQSARHPASMIMISG
jgi:hypothetical protein